VTDALAAAEKGDGKGAVRASLAALYSLGGLGILGSFGILGILGSLPITASPPESSRIRWLRPVPGRPRFRKDPRFPSETEAPAFPSDREVSPVVPKFSLTPGKSLIERRNLIRLLSGVGSPRKTIGDVRDIRDVRERRRGRAYACQTQCRTPGTSGGLSVTRGRKRPESRYVTQGTQGKQGKQGKRGTGKAGETSS
jgi:hypothetical protein